MRASAAKSMAKSGEETKQTSRTRRKKMAAAMSRAKLHRSNTLPRSILSRLGSYVQIFGMFRAHPCYLFELYKNLFHGNEAIGLASRANYVKFSARRFFSLVTTIYCDIGQDSAHQNFFLLFTKKVIIKELSKLSIERMSRVGMFGPRAPLGQTACPGPHRRPPGGTRNH